VVVVRITLLPEGQPTNPVRHRTRAGRRHPGHPDARTPDTTKPIAADGPQWSKSLISNVFLVAWGGIEPPTRGFSRQITLGLGVLLSRRNVTAFGSAGCREWVLTEPVAELPGVGRAMPIRNVEWNQRYSGGPAELPLMDSHGGPAGGGRGWGRQCSPWRRYGPAMPTWARLSRSASPARQETLLGSWPQRASGGFDRKLTFNGAERVPDGTYRRIAPL